MDISQQEIEQINEKVMQDAIMYDNQLKDMKLRQNLITDELNICKDTIAKSQDEFDREKIKINLDNLEEVDKLKGEVVDLNEDKNRINDEKYQQAEVIDKKTDEIQRLEIEL